MRGKFIAVYGINNIGKSTQTALLVQRLIASNVRVEYIKYPIYDLDPTGKQLNEILRGKQNHNIQAMINFFEGTRVKKPNSRRKHNTVFRRRKIAPTEVRQQVTEEELQMWYSLNRYQFDPTARRKIESGVSIVAEDYTGTGLAWGSAKGADIEWLESVNKFLYKPDLEILIDGERFLHAKEKVHLHESSERLMRKSRKKFLELGRKNGWKKVNANQSIEEVNAEIWQIVQPLFGKETNTKNQPALTNWQTPAVDQ